MGWTPKRVGVGLLAATLLLALAFTKRGGQDFAARRLYNNYDPTGGASSSSGSSGGGGIAEVYGGTSSQATNAGATNPYSSSSGSSGQAYNPYQTQGDGKSWKFWKYLCGGGFSAFSTLTIFIYACLYKNWVVDQLPSHTGYGGADFPKLFDCFMIQDGFKCCTVCAWSWFCWPVLSAKNYAATETCSFWPSLCLLWCGYSCGWVPGAMVKTCLSMRMMDDALDLEANCCTEFFNNLCCVWCQTARESMMVDEELDVTISCPFQVEEKGAVESFVKDIGEVLGLEDKRCDVLEEKHRRRDRMCSGASCNIQ